MAKQDDFVRYTIRVPAELYRQLQEAAGMKSVNAEIVDRLASSFSAGANKIDPTHDDVQQTMVQRVRELMDGVVDEMREETRISEGLPLLMRWFDANPDERAAYDKLSSKEQDEFVREKSLELRLERLNGERAKAPSRKTRK